MLNLQVIVFAGEKPIAAYRTGEWPKFGIGTVQFQQEPDKKWVQIMNASVVVEEVASAETPLPVIDGPLVRLM